jgi:DNA-binding transcriptional LysR family regulator
MNIGIAAMKVSEAPADRGVWHGPEIGDSIPKLTLRQLSYFLAAASHQSVLKGAQALNVSAPSVSTAIAQIEAVAEAQLFVRRHARGLVLTQIGRDLAVSARNVLLHAREIETAFHNKTFAIYGRLNIGCLVSFAPFLIPLLLKRFREPFPRIQLHCREGNHEALIDGLESGTFDLALLYDFDIPTTIHCAPLRSMPPQIVLPAAHPLAARPSLGIHELVDQPLVLLDLPRTRDYFLSVFGELGLEPRIVHRTPSFETVRSLVANGLGYSLLNFCPPYSFPGGGALVSRPLENVKAPNLVLARLYRYRAPRMVEEFTRCARDVSATLPEATDVAIAGHHDKTRCAARGRKRVVSAVKRKRHR